MEVGREHPPSISCPDVAKHLVRHLDSWHESACTHTHTFIYIRPYQNERKGLNHADEDETASLHTSIRWGDVVLD